MVYMRGRMRIEISLFLNNGCELVRDAHFYGHSFHSRIKMAKKTKIKAEKRDEKNKPKMKVSGKSVFKIQEIIIKKAKNKK
jgi:hypothetical protein